MTKRNLLVSLFLVFGLSLVAASAMAQTQWTPGAGQGNVFMRHEGEAEATGVFSLDNYTVGYINPGSQFILTYTAPIVAGSALVQCSDSNSGQPFPVTPGGDCVNVYPVFTLAYTKYTLTLTYLSQSTNHFTSTNHSVSVVVRVDATQITCATDVVQVAVVAKSTYSPISTGNLTVTDNTYRTVGSLGKNAAGLCEPVLSLTFAAVDRKSRHSDTWTTTPGVAADVLSCIGVKDIGTYENKICLNVDEEFEHALTTESFEDTLDPDATNGTSVDIVFTGVPDGVGIEFDSTTPCSSLPAVDPNSCNNVPPGYTGTLTVGLDTAGCSKNISGTITCTFDTLTMDNGMAENVDLCFKFWSHGQLPPGLPEIYANVYKDPTSSSDIPYFTGHLELGAPGLSVVDFTDCMSFLLYPYVASEYGYDTGLTVSNTTLDPFNIPMPPNPLDLQPQYGMGSAVPQTGPCQFYIYSNGTTPWFATFPTSSIMPGQSLSFYLSGNAPGANGYAIAVCAFQNAVGQATIQFDSPGRYDSLETGYLALTIPDPQWYHRSPAGKWLGEFAIAPGWDGVHHH
jgi:hypothetical protein